VLEFMKSNMSVLTRKLKSVLRPLSRAEERRAIQAALQYYQSETSDASEARFRLLGAELRLDKPPKRGAIPPRLIQVLLVDYTHKRNLDFSVDAKGKVVRSGDLGFQPAFHAEEVREARELADSDERLVRILKKRGAFVSAFAPGSATDKESRLLGLRYVVPSKNGVDHLASAVINLSEGRLLSVTEHQTTTSKY